MRVQVPPSAQDMPKSCDHKSVGMLVWKGDKLLLIERKKPPFGFAAPAGHIDEDVSFEEAAKRELEEETGLGAENVKLLAEGEKENPCRREGGNWHYWKIYQIETSDDLTLGEDETKQANFYNKSDLLSLAAKTESYLRRDIKQEDWDASPGLEPVWLEWLKELKII